ncbi:MAG TPA: short-chain dehydrogenase, partial [Candidatus Binatia bacterium]|nr:short-chain dehydrogenase [Candidatus Binatia bacterium]
AASVPTQVIYFCALVAALVRIVAAFEPSSALLYAAAFAWVLAFGAFAVIFGPLLLGRSPTREERK